MKGVKKRKSKKVYIVVIIMNNKRVIMNKITVAAVVMKKIVRIKDIIRIRLNTINHNKKLIQYLIKNKIQFTQI